MVTGSIPVAPMHHDVSALEDKQFGQYQGAGVLTGFGLLLRHLAQRWRLPFTAVFGRTLFPVLNTFFANGASAFMVSFQNTKSSCRERQETRRLNACFRLKGLNGEGSMSVEELIDWAKAFPTEQKRRLVP